MTTRARETRRSPPYLTADGTLDFDIEVQPPVYLRGRTIDAADLPRDEPLEASLTICVGWDELRRDTGVSQPVALQVVARCPSTRWSRVATVAENVDDTDRNEFKHFFRLDRELINETVNAEIAIALSQEAPDNPSGVAQERHHVLARQQFKVRFERAGFEFPTRWISFEDRYPEQALWTVHIEPDSWTESVEDAVEIRLNEDIRDFYRLLESGRREHRLPAQVVRTQIAYDTLNQIFQEYFLDDTANEAIDPEGSRLCDVIHRTVKDLFPASPATVQTWFKEDRLLFRTRLQDAMDFDEMINL